MTGQCLVFLDESVHPVLGTICVGDHLKYAGQTEQGFLCLSVCHHLQQRSEVTEGPGTD
jgi:hypothetical protein